MAKATKKRMSASPPKKTSASKKARESGYLLGTGGAGRAAKKIQSRRAANRDALQRAINARKGK